MARGDTMSDTRAEAIEVLISGATHDDGLGPALGYDMFAPALAALGVPTAEVDAACDRMGRWEQQWRDTGKRWPLGGPTVLNGEPLPEVVSSGLRFPEGENPDA